MNSAPISTVKIVVSPFTSPVGTAENLVLIVLGLPSAAGFDVLAAPDIRDFQANADQDQLLVRNATTAHHGPHTKPLHFDFGSHQRHTIQVEHRYFEVTLMQTGVESLQGQNFPWCEFQVAEVFPTQNGSALNLDREGTVSFWLKGDGDSWWTNGKRLKFPNITGPQVSVSSEKFEDNTIEVEISGPFRQAFVFRRPIPPSPGNGLFVALRWKDNRIELFLNGQSVETKLSAN